MLLRHRFVTIGNLIAIVTAILSTLVAGCATKGSSSWIGGGQPDWVAQGVVVKEGQLLATGAVSGIKNGPLAWEIADQRARGQIAKALHSQVAVLLRDYTEAVGHDQTSREEQLAQRVQTTFAAQTLYGVEQIDRYHDRETDTYYVQVRWKQDHLRDIVNALSGLNDQAREAVRERADRLFRELERRQATPEQGTPKRSGETKRESDVEVSPAPPTNDQSASDQPASRQSRGPISAPPNFRWWLNGPSAPPPSARAASPCHGGKGLGHPSC